MQFDLKVTATANKKDFIAFGVEVEGNTKLKWYNCTENVYNFLTQVKPAIITIDEQQEDLVKRVNLVKKLESKELNLGTAPVKSFLSNHSPDSAPSQSTRPTFDTLLFGSLDSNTLIDYLSLAEDSLLNRKAYLESKKQTPTNKIKEDLDAVNHKIEKLYKLMDELQNG